MAGRRPQSLPILLSLACGLLVGPAEPAFADPGPHRMVADTLYQVAEEHRRRGDTKGAIHELEKALIADPAHEQAADALAQLKGELAAREEAMDRALAELAALPAEAPPQRPVSAPAEIPAVCVSTTPSAAPPAIGATTTRAAKLPKLPVKPRRVPDPLTNGIRWFYVFGPDGHPADGALREAHRVTIEVRADSLEPVRVRVLDADARDKRDEMRDGWNTTTVFRVLGAAGLLVSETVGPEAPDGTVVEFGPFDPAQGELREAHRLFHVEAEGLLGDDNNLFAFEVWPRSAQCSASQPSVRLPERPGAVLTMFPAVPSGASLMLIESNYDLDAEGGRAWLIRRRADGSRAGWVPIRSSLSGVWATTEVAVPPGTAGARWTYRVVKGAQRNANMAFRFTDASGHALPVYTTRGRSLQRPEQAPSPPVELATPGGACNTFTFDASGSHDPDHDPLTFSWDFGDGATAEGARVTHRYAGAGDYRVVLTVTDTSTQACARSQVEQTVSVNQPPTAVFEAPERVCAGQEARFSAAGSSDSPGEWLSYRWDFGDGTTAVGPEATHVFAAGGAYAVRLTVDDGRDTACSTATVTATVRANSPPVAKAPEAISLCARSGREPLDVVLSAEGSHDDDRDPLTYRWDFGDGAAAEGLKVRHTYDRGGRYTALLMVDDGAGTACSLASAAVPVSLNRAPQAVVPPLVEGCEGEPVTFDASRSSDPDDDPLTYQWEFGDGAPGFGATPTHLFPAYGRFAATVTVDDGQGMACSRSRATVTADINAKPVAQMDVTPAP